MSRKRTASSTHSDGSYKLSMEESCPTRLQGRLLAKQIAKTIFRIILLVALIIGAVYGGNYVWEKYILENKDLNIDQLQYSSNGLLTQQDVLDYLGISATQNILFINIEEIEAKLKERPDIASAKVQRNSLTQLIIKIEERIPALWVECPQNRLFAHQDKESILSDASGHLFTYDKRLHEERIAGLPIIKIPPPIDGSYNPGEWLEGTMARQALSFVNLLHKDAIHTPTTIPPLESLDYPTESSFIARFANGMQITFHPFELERQIDDLKKIISYAEGQNKFVKSANLVAKRNIPVQITDKPEEIFEAEIVEEDIQLIPSTTPNGAPTLEDTTPAKITPIPHSAQKEAPKVTPPPVQNKNITPTPAKEDKPHSASSTKSSSDKKSAPSSTSDKPKSAASEKNTKEKTSTKSSQNKPAVKKEADKTPTKKQSSTSNKSSTKAKPKPDPKPASKPASKPAPKQAPQPQQPAKAPIKIPDFNW